MSLALLKINFKEMNEIYASGPFICKGPSRTLPNYTHNFAFFS